MIGNCQHCEKAIRRFGEGRWEAREISDAHPWHCDANPDGEKRHEPNGLDSWDFYLWISGAEGPMSACDHPLDGHTIHGPWCEPSTATLPNRKD